MKKHMTTGYQGFALLLGALGLVAVACSDDDDDSPDNSAGKGGSTAGKSSGGSSGKGGSSTAGKDSGGDASGGKSGSSTGGTSMAGEGQGGEPTAGTGAGGEPAGGAPGGGAGGEGVGGSGEGGAGGEASVVFDTLDNANFNTWTSETVVYGAGWSSSGDVAATHFDWDNDVGANMGTMGFWHNAAYKATIWQTVNPIANGTYQLKADVRSGTGFVEFYLFAKGCKAGDAEYQFKKDITGTAEATYTTFTLENIEVTSGTCSLGVYVDAPSTAWARADNFIFTKVD